MASLKDILIQVRGETRDAVAALDKASEKLDAFDGKNPQAHLDVAMGEFRAHIEQAEALLDAAARDRHVSIKAKVRIEKQGDLLQDFAREAEAALSQPRGDKGQFLPFNINDIQNDFRLVKGGLTDMQDGFDSAARAGDKLPKVFDDLSLTLSRLYPALVGILIIIGVSLVGALSALVGSAAAAVGGVGALAAAFMGALIPAGVILFGVMQRLAQAMLVYKASQQAQIADAARAARVASQVEANHNREAVAASALASATDQLTKSRRDYTRAVEDARTAISKARRQVIDDSRAIVDAQRDMDDADTGIDTAKQEGYRAWADAVERVKDAQLDLRESILDVADAQLNAMDAQDKLNALLNAIPSDKIGDVLKKLADVNLDPAAAAQFVQAAAGPGADPKLGEKIVRAQLDVARARLDVDKANDKVHDSTVELTRATEDNNKFTTLGVLAYAPYIDALNRRRDAHHRLNEAIRRHNTDEREYHKLLKQGVNGADAVVNAQFQIRSALRAVATARREVRNATVEGQLALKGITAQDARVLGTLKQLSPAEQHFAKQLIHLQSVFIKLLQPATDAFFRLFSRGLSGAEGMLRRFAPQLNHLGKIMAFYLGQILKEFGRPEWQRFFKQMISLAVSVTRHAAPGFIALANIFRHIATAAAPFLIKAIDWIVRLLQSMERGSHGNQFSKLIKLMVDSTFAWLSLLRPLSRLFLAFMKAAAPFGNEFVKWMARAADQMARWMDSEEGRREIKQFFEATMPLAKSILRLLGALSLLFLRMYEASAPFLQGMMDGFTSMAKGATIVFGLLADLTRGPLHGLTYIFGVIIAQLVGSKGIGLVFKIVGRLAAIAAGQMSRLFVKIPLLLKPIFTLLFKIGQLFSGVGKLGLTFAAKTAGWIGALALSALGLGKSLADNILNGLKAAGGALGDAAKWAWTQLRDSFSRQFQRMRDTGAWIISRIVEGAKRGAAALSDAGVWLWGQIESGVTSMLADIKDAGSWIINRTIDGLKSAPGDIKDAGAWIWARMGDGLTAVASLIIDAGSWIFAQLKAGVEAKVDDVKNVGGAIVGWIRDGFGAAVAAVSMGPDLVGNVANGIVSFIGAGARGVADAGGAIADFITGGIEGIYTFGERIVKAAANGIVNFVKAGAKGAADAGGAIANFIINGIEGLYSIGEKLVRNVANGVHAGIKTAGKALRSAGRSIGNAIKRGIDAVGGFAHLGAEAVRGFVHGVGEMIKWVIEKGKDVARGLLHAIKKFLHIESPSKEMMKLGQHAIQGFIDGLDLGNMIDLAKSAFGSLKDAVVWMFRKGWLDVTPGNIVKVAGAVGMKAVDLAKKIGGGALGAVKGLLGLAEGGLVTSARLRVIGEGAYDEAVLPLSEAVFDQLGRGIAKSLEVSAPKMRMPGMIEPSALWTEGIQQMIDQTFNLIVPDTGASKPDMRAASADLAREARRRNGFTRT